MKRIVLMILMWVMVAFWFGVIFLFSAKDGTDSTKQSMITVETTVRDVAKIARKIGIIKEMPTESRINQIVNQLNPLVRKLAHAMVYFVLAFLVLCALWTKEDNYLRNVLIALLICFIYSLTDEYHQTFVEGRTGAFTDCLIDTGGAVFACLLYQVGIWIHKMLKKSNNH